MPRPQGDIPNLKIPQEKEAKILSKIFEEVDRTFPQETKLKRTDLLLNDQPVFMTCCGENFYSYVGYDSHRDSVHGDDGF